MPRVRRMGAYLINDTFTTDRAAGSVNGTPAEPGPGVRTVTDTTNKLSLSSGNLILANQASSEDPRLGINTPIERLPGRILSAQLSLAASTTGRVGWGLSDAGQNNHGVAFNSSGLIVSMESQLSGSRTLASWAASTAYQVWVLLRTSGHFIFIKGGVWAYPTLLWISNAASNTPQYLKLSQNSTGTVTYGYGRVPSALWLPVPLASDGFSSWGTTDGLGHAEGVAGGLGAGGSGLTWTQAVGTWGASAGSAAASALSGGVAMTTVDTGKADVIVTAKVTRSGGNGGVICRYVDANNLVGARHTGTNAQLFKIVAGVATTLVDVVSTYAAGAEVRVICEGQKFRLYYNNALIGSEQSIADAALASATLVGLRSTDTGNTFDDFRVWARGSGGEYAALDNY